MNVIYIDIYIHSHIIVVAIFICAYERIQVACVHKNTIVLCNTCSFVIRMYGVSKNAKKNVRTNTNRSDFCGFHKNPRNNSRRVQFHNVSVINLIK